MREEFEKLPEIAMVLEENPDIRFEDDNYIYHGLDEVTALATMFIFGAYFAFQEQQEKIDAHNEKLSLFIGELKKTHSEDMLNKMDYWRGFSDCAETTVKVFYRDVGVITCKE